jgi:hypothetical protein
MTGNHQPETHNYFVGDRFGVGRDFRNFFVFDLAGVTQPIASAKLALFVPILPEPGYESPDPSENYELHDVVTPFATLLDGTGGVAAHADLGSGVVYGSRTMTAAFGNDDYLAFCSFVRFTGRADCCRNFSRSLRPEPATIGLIGTSCLVFLGLRRRLVTSCYQLQPVNRCAYKCFAGWIEVSLIRTITLGSFALCMSANTFVASAVADTFGAGPNSFQIDFVTVGNPGNPPDANPNPAGAVPYDYRIAKYEISEQMIDKANSEGGRGITESSENPFG